MALGWLTALVLIALFGRFILPQSPYSQNLIVSNTGPSIAHWLGADDLGRDILSRLIAASRVTLMAAGIGLSIAAGIGVPLGMLAGARPSVLDAVLSRISDTLLSIPGLILALAIVGVLGKGLVNVMVAVGVVLSPRFFRITRGATRSVMKSSYITAARADGCSSVNLLLRHVFPNIVGPLLVQLSFTAGFAITAEAALSFLGLGVEIPQASWGGMLQDAFDQAHQSTFQIYPPAFLITATVIAFAVLGDGLRDSFGRGSATE